MNVDRTWIDDLRRRGKLCEMVNTGEGVTLLDGN